MYILEELKKINFAGRPWFKYWPPGLLKIPTYPTAPLHEYLVTTARRFPNKGAIVYYGNEITYEKLDALSDSFAVALNGLGVKKGDRVALYLQNCPQYVISFYGVLKAGAVVIPINPMLKADKLRYLLCDSNAEILIALDDLYSIIEQVKGETNLKNVIVTNCRDFLPKISTIPLHPSMTTEKKYIPDTHDFVDLLEKHEKAQPPEVAVDVEKDLAVIPYTAGTTGLPKGCAHNHRTVITTMYGSVLWRNLQAEHTCLVALPLFHVTAMQHDMNASIFVGATMVVLTRWDPETAAKAIEKYRCTHWMNISTMVIGFLNYSGLEKVNLSSLVFIGGGGAPLLPAIGEKLYRRTGLKYVESYGLTEVISQSHFNPLHAPKLGSPGIPHFGVDQKVIDPETCAELPIGQEGELVLMGPNVMKGYWDKPEETEKAFVTIDGEKWFRTGDIVKIGEDGYLHIVGRIKDMINAAGYKVWPAEVEDVMLRHPAIAEVAVIGVPDPYRIENVKAFVVPRAEWEDRTSDDEIIRWCREKMAVYKVPRIIEFTKELPKSGAGKVLKRILREKETERITKEKKNL